MTLPEGFLNLISQYPSTGLKKLAEALHDAPVTSVRANRHKPLPAIMADPALDVVPWCAEGRYLTDRPLFTLDPALHQGRYYVQDASSMFISHAIRHITAGTTRPLRVLDACAAPGGKSTAAIDALPEGSMLVANEYVAQRASILRENLIKWGSPLTMAVSHDTAEFGRHPASFDMILADVPCSGEGMMRKDPHAVEQWSEGLVAQCARLQRTIIDNLWPALRPGGVLIYSTCTFNRHENEEQIRYIIDRYGAEPIAIPVEPDWGVEPGIMTDIPCLRFIPGSVRGEGLFMAALRKNDGEQPAAPTHRKQKNQRGKSPAVDPALLRQAATWLDGNIPVELSVNPVGSVTATVNSTITLPEFRPVITVGHVKGRDLIPDQQLAMSTMLKEDAFERVEVDQPVAVAYLRREAISLPGSAPRGIVLLTYDGAPLGFVKNIGNRANNLYPDRWKILMQYEYNKK